MRSLETPIQTEVPQRNKQRAVELSFLAEQALRVMAAGARSRPSRAALVDVRDIYARSKDHVLDALFGDAVLIDRQGGWVPAEEPGPA